MTSHSARRGAGLRVSMFAVAAMTACATFSATSVSAADGTDAVTGLPLYPGISSPDVMTSPMCGGSNGKMALYYPSGSLPTVDKWFAAHLHGFERVSGRTDRPQIGYYKPGGKLIVGITGTPNGKDVYAITYISANPPLAHEHLMGTITQHC